MRAHFAERISADVVPSLPRSRGLLSSLGPALRPLAVPVTVALVLVFGVEGIGTAAASALPGTPLYPAKLVAEQVQLLVAYSPEQQANAHLNIAAARLEEAIAVNQGGDSAKIPALLQSFHEQVAEAEVAATKVQSPQYHEKVSKTIASLEDRQRKIPPVVAGSNRGRGRRPEPTGAAYSQPTTVAPAKPDHESGGPSAKPSPGPLDEKDEIATPEPSTVAPEPSNTPTPQQNAPALDNQPTEQLLKTLIAQAMAGDVGAATTTSHAYVLAVRSDAFGGDGAVNKLRGQRAQLQQVIGRAPTSTRQPLQDAIDAIDAILANAPGADHQTGNRANGSSKENGATADNPPSSSDSHHGNLGGGGGSGNAGGHGGDGSSTADDVSSNGKRH